MNPKTRKSTLSELEQAKQSSKQQHGSAVNTNITYYRYNRRGKQWLAKLGKDPNSVNGLKNPKASQQALMEQSGLFMILFMLLTQE